MSPWGHWQNRIRTARLGSHLSVGLAAWGTAGFAATFSGCVFFPDKKKKKKKASSTFLSRAGANLI